MNKKTLAIIESYGRSAFVCLATVYVTNPEGSLQDIWKAFLVAFAAPILRAINPNDEAFGIGSKK
ncbi:hypothetical protein UFOVP537_14 [uncultured Caudovirales phage]|jgi:hypothetical protein|uniref:Uncharacterized protein n=1 Tax=uncultured Caudovirales phage TaxID=2100421 RepID=A0A6J5MUK8_9CAUD|nr:hypothetical protein UFOVP537_14 [uncultured Caudovirales phage]